MYDSVNFRLWQTDVSTTDLLAEIPLYLENVSEHLHSDGSVVLTGSLPSLTSSMHGLTVSVNEHQMKIKDGSLCKWYLGDNFKTMGRGDAQRAVEALSDAVHAPIDRAVITRLDVAQNIITRHPTGVYLNHLGTVNRFKRLEQPDGLYYRQTDKCLCFYDKIKEQKNKHESIPDLYMDRNVLRYEQRYTGRLAKAFHVPEVTGASLYNEQFYMTAVDNWLSAYKAIDKVKIITLNFENMKGTKDMYMMGVAALAKMVGGQLDLIEQIKEAQMKGQLTNKQAHDMRAAAKAAFQRVDALTAKDDAIDELDRKVKDAVKYYR